LQEEENKIKHLEEKKHDDTKRENKQNVIAVIDWGGGKGVNAINV
jgi:hypothetical protein